MAWTPAQRKANEAAMKKLAEARKHISGGGGRGSWTGGGSSGSVTLSPSQNLAIKEGRNPNLTPSQRLAAEQGRITDSSRKSSSSYSRAALQPQQAFLQQQKAQQAAALQKAQDAAAVRLADAQAKLELNRITAIQQNIIKNKGQITQKKLIDSKTRNVLEVTRYSSNGDYVQRIYDTVTGEIKFHAFGSTRNGGKKSRVGVTIGGTKLDPRLGEKLVKFDPKKVNASLKREDAGFTTLDLSNRLTGLERISSFTANRARQLVKKLESGVGLNAKDKAILLGLQFAIPAQQLIIGAKQLPSFAVSLVKNPKNIIKVPGQILTGFKESGLEIIALAKVDPALAIARIGGEIITFKAVTGGLRVTGKVTSVAASKIAPVLKPIRHGAVIVRTTTKTGLLKFRVVSKKAGRAITQKSKIARGVVKTTKSVKKVRRIVKETQKAEIIKFKSAVQYSKEMNIARNARKIARKKGRTVNIGDRDFIEGVAFIEEVADKLAKSRAKQFIQKYKARGLKLGLGEEENFIRSIRRIVKKNLNDDPNFKRLKDYSKLTEPYQIKIIKINKLLSAKKLVGKIISKIKNLSISKRADALLKIIAKTGRKIKKAPMRIKKRLTVKRLQRVARKQFRKTNRYRMQKTRGIRKVTTQQIERSLSVNQYRKFVDDLFDEVAIRQKIPTSSLKYRQFKNVVKKRISWAIKRGDVTEISKFKVAIKKIVQDMDKPTKSPVVRIVKKGTRSYKTIENFKPEVPKGKYVEVKRGQQVLLQEVRQVQQQVQKVKTVQKFKPQQQVYIIQSVQKQSINLKPLLQFAVGSLSAQAFGTLQKQQQKMKSGQVLSAKQITKVLQDSAQDFKVLQVVAQDVSPRLNVAQTIRQDVATKQKFRPLLKTKQITKQVKKPIPRRKIEKPKNIRILPKKVMTYAFVVKKAGKNVRLKIPPMTLKDSWDVGAFRLDHDLQRTGSLIAVGMTNKVAKISKSVKGYYGKHKKKFRRFRVKKGKKFTLQRTIIEKRKYIGDTKSEIKALQKSRRKSSKKVRRTKRKRSKKR